MTPEAIQKLGTARESLSRRRDELAEEIGKASKPSIASTEKLTKVLAAIEGIDRALNEAGQPYMSAALQEGSGKAPAKSATKPSARKPRPKSKELPVPAPPKSIEVGKSDG
jgi:hypothetical protein